MKSFFTWIAICCIGFLQSGCTSSPTKEPRTEYEKAYDTQFPELIKSLDRTPDVIDTLYTEMYIALQTMRKDEAAGDIVVDRVNRLIELDTIKENQRHYLEALSIAYSLRKDYDNFWRTALKSYDTYPTNSFQRLSSLAAYYTYIDINPDSAAHYIAAAHRAADRLKHSDSANDRMGYYFGKATLYTIDGKDENAKAMLRECIANENDEEGIQEAKSALADFDAFKASLIPTLP